MVSFTTAVVTTFPIETIFVYVETVISAVRTKETFRGSLPVVFEGHPGETSRASMWEGW